MGNPLRAAGSDDYSTLENDDSAGSAKRRRRSRWMLALAVISLCALGSALAVVFRKQVLAACYRIGRLPPVAGGLLFSALLALWLTCLLPTSLLEIAAGFVFGSPGRRFGQPARSSAVYLRIGRPRHLCGADPGRRHEQGARLFARLQNSNDRGAGPTCLALRLAYVPEAIQNCARDLRPIARFSCATGGSAIYAALWANPIGDVAELSATESARRPRRPLFYASAL